MADKEEKGPAIRQGTDVDPRGGEEYQARRLQDGVISSNGVFTKVLREGRVEVVPTSEVYAHEPDERIDGVEVDDRTVTGPLGMPGQAEGQIVDRLEREFNTGKRGDAISAHHAQGASGTIPVEREPEEGAELDEGAYEEDLEDEAERHEKATKAATKAAKKTTSTAKKSSKKK